jgi:hypothetical protein
MEFVEEDSQVRELVYDLDRLLDRECDRTRGKK